MTLTYDEKGKIFTDIIPKESIPVIIQTVKHQIHGYFHARMDNRLKDELNREQEEQFMAITDAIVLDDKGRELHRADFLALNRNNIIWLIPKQKEEDIKGDEG
jgi:hypothetical protein